MEKEVDFMPKEFDPNNFHFSSLACYAATAIDNHIIGRSHVDYSDLIRLGKIMYMSTEPQFTRHNPTYVAAREDPLISVFLARFLERVTNKFPETIDDVVSQTKEIALNLIKMKELPRDEQVRLRDICVKLSESSRNFWYEYNSPRRYCAA